MIHCEEIETAIADLGVFSPVDGPASLQALVNALRDLEAKVQEDGICVQCLMTWTQNHGITLELLGGHHAFVSGFFAGVHASIRNEHASQSDTEPDDAIQTWVSDDRCTLMTRYVADGIVHVATRSEDGAVWGPPVALTRES